MNLREAREQLGLSQTDLSVRTGIASTYLSQQESGVKDLNLDDMVACEGELGMRVDWPDIFDEGEKIQVVQAIMTLASRYPLLSVLDFVRKVLANRREKAPVNLLRFYSQAAVAPGISPHRPSGAGPLS